MAMTISASQRRGSGGCAAAWPPGAPVLAGAVPAAAVLADEVSAMVLLDMRCPFPVDYLGSPGNGHASPRRPRSNYEAAPTIRSRWIKRIESDVRWTHDREQ